MCAGLCVRVRVCARKTVRGHGAFTVAALRKGQGHTWQPGPAEKQSSKYSPALRKGRCTDALAVDAGSPPCGLRYRNALSTRLKRGWTLLKRVRAVVNVDSVAAGPLPLYVWASRADPELARMALGIDRVLKIPVEGMNVEKVGNSDTAPFRDAKVPTIDFHALTNKTWPILHTIDDQLSMVNVDAYKATYRFLAVYLKYLDEALAPAGSSTAGLN